MNEKSQKNFAGNDDARDSESEPPENDPLLESEALPRAAVKRRRWFEWLLCSLLTLVCLALLADDIRLRRTESYATGFSTDMCT